MADREVNDSSGAGSYDATQYHEVAKGDTLWKISAITGVPIDELERLNNISRDDPLTVGTVLILRIVQPTYAEPTLAFQPSATPSLLPVTGKGTICVAFFDDPASRQDNDRGRSAERTPIEGSFHARGLFSVCEHFTDPGIDP